MALLRRVTDVGSLTTSVSTSRTLPAVLGVRFCAMWLIGLEFEKDELIVCC